MSAPGASVTDMLMQKLYLRLPPLAQELGVSAYGLALAGQRFRGPFRRHLRFLADSEGWDANRMLAYRMDELRRVLRHAVETVPYYRRRWSAEVIADTDPQRTLAGLPLLDRGEVRSHPEAFLSTAVPARGRVWLSTSGTTGTPQRVAVDHRSRQENYAYLFRLRRWVGVERARRRAVFVGRVLGTDRQLARRPWRVDHSTTSAFFSSYHIGSDTVERYVEGFRRFRPEWIEGYPTAIATVARLAREQGFSLPPVRAVIATCETLTPETRQTIEQGFGCRVTDYYGSAEQAAFISECERGSYHLHPEYGWAEFVEAGEDAGGTPLYELVTTSFRNQAMPLVRYRTGDLVSRQVTRCDCGRPFPVIDRIVGRAYDVIVTPDGRRIAGIGPALKGLPIDESQLVQVAPDVVEFRFVPTGGVTGPSFEQAVMDRLRPRLGSAVTIRLQPTTALPRGANGKFRMIINETTPPHDARHPASLVADAAGGK